MSQFTVPRLQKAVWIGVFLMLMALITIAVIWANPFNHPPAHPESSRVLVIANRNSPVSLRVAQYYMQRRGIPTTHFLTLNLFDSSQQPVFESIEYPIYQQQVEQPLREFLNREQLTDQIRYIVLTKGVPLRVKNVPHPFVNGETFIQHQSLDSTIAALDYKTSAIAFRDLDYKKMSGSEVFGLLTPNLYWRQTYPFEHRLTGGYLVTRLDGYHEADARALVDRALTPRPSLSGTVLLDAFHENESSGEPQLVDIFDPKACTLKVVPNCTPQPRGMWEASGQDINNDLRLSQQLIKASFSNLQVMFAPPKTFARGDNLIAYASWGSNDPVFRLEDYQSLQFLPGAIAETVVSSSGRTFFPTSTGQSLLGDLMSNSQGVTGIRGYVEEPELQGIGSPTVLFGNYFAGVNLANAYYRSIRFVGWRDLVLGDPLATAVFDN